MYTFNSERLPFELYRSSVQVPFSKGIYRNAWIETPSLLAFSFTQQLATVTITHGLITAQWTESKNEKPILSTGSRRHLNSGYHSRVFLFNSNINSILPVHCWPPRFIADAILIHIVTRRAHRLKVFVFPRGKENALWWHATESARQMEKKIANHNYLWPSQIQYYHFLLF